MSSTKNSPSKEICSSSMSSAITKSTMSSMKNSPSKEICSSSMSSAIFLDDLKPATPERKSIRVRFVRMWQDYIFNDKTKQGDDRKSGQGYIVADAKGNFAHAKLTTTHEPTFKHKVIHQGVYDMSHFNVLPCKKGFNHTKMLSMITFDKCTNLRPIKGTFPSIPTEKSFEFVKFEDIAAMLANTFLIDVVGFVQSCYPVIESGTKKRRNIILRDEKDALMKVTIWDEQIECFDENKVQEQCVLVLASVSVSEYNDEITISTKPSTMFYYNLDIPEVHALKGSGLSVKMEYVEHQKAEYVDWKNYKRTTLGEMVKLYKSPMEKGVSYTCECTLTNFWRKWYYSACKQCLLGVKTNDKGMQYCENCNKVTKTLQAYNADVEVADKEHSYDATIWANALENYFHVDIHDLPNLVNDGCVVEHMFREKLEDQTGLFQISMKTFKGKMALSIVKFSPSTHDEEQDSEDHDTLICVGSPLQMVTTPSKGESSYSKKRKAHNTEEDGSKSEEDVSDKVQDGSKSEEDVSDKVQDGNDSSNTDEED